MKKYILRTSQDLVIMTQEEKGIIYKIYIMRNTSFMKEFKSLYERAIKPNGFWIELSDYEFQEILDNNNIDFI